MHVRHILFAVTPGVNVYALSQRAEVALLELSRIDVPPGRFEALAAELSNCPSSAQGGDLDWLTPEDCAPELPAFEQAQARIQAQLALQSRSTALRQYVQLLVGLAQVAAIELEGADSPLVQ